MFPCASENVKIIWKYVYPSDSYMKEKGKISYKYQANSNEIFLKTI